MSEAIERYCKNEGVPLLSDEVTRIDLRTRTLEVYEGYYGIETSTVPRERIPLPEEARLTLSTQGGEVFPVSPKDPQFVSLEGSERQADLLIYTDRQGQRAARALADGWVFESKALEPLRTVEHVPFQ